MVNNLGRGKVGAGYEGGGDACKSTTDLRRMKDARPGRKKERYSKER